MSSDAHLAPHPTHPASQSEAAFICTICWQDQHHPAKPKLLGASARIVCLACWCAVLDLSICWRCGECVVRGEEVVSLGWCFWHRACFGCLICGSQMDLSLDEAEDKRGLELDGIPLCGWCKVEAEGQDEEVVEERGLETVSRFDGGLSRGRRDKLRMGGETRERLREAHQLLVKTPRHSRDSMKIEKQTKAFFTRSLRSADLDQETEEDQLRLLHNSPDRRISENGSVDVSHKQFDCREAEVDSNGDELRDPQVYISIIDPIGQPAFKPSRTKPLPKWMSLLPSNVHKEPGEQQKNLMEYPSNPKDLSCINESSDCDDQSSSRSKTTNPEEPKLERCSERGGCPRGCSSENPVEKRRRATTSSQSSHTRDRTHGKRRSPSTRSAYRTAQGYPSTQQPMLPFHSLGPSEMRKEPTSYFCGAALHNAHPTKESCCALAQHTPTPDLLELGLLELATSTALPTPSNTLMSNFSEYMDRYQSKTPSTRHKTFVAKDPERIIDKIRRQSLKLKSVDDGREKSKKKKEAMMKQIDEEFGMDPRREDLNKELRNLFCEE